MSKVQGMHGPINQVSKVQGMHGPKNQVSKVQGMLACESTRKVQKTRKSGTLRIKQLRPNTLRFRTFEASYDSFSDQP